MAAISPDSQGAAEEGGRNPSDSTTTASSAPMAMLPGRERSLLRMEVAAVMALFLFPGICWTIYNWIQFQQQPQSQFSPRLWGEIIWLVPTVSLLCYLAVRNSDPWARIGLVRPRASDLLYAILIMAVDLAVIALCAPDLPDLAANTDATIVSAANSALSRPPHPLGFPEYMLVISACLATGISEELLFRGYLITRLEAVAESPITPLLLSSVLFSMGHLYQGGWGILGTVVTGLVYGVAFLKLRRLTPLVLAHAMHNMVVISGKGV